MSPARSGELITFYSYKGGVGRSAAVANIGTLLAQQGRRVLLIDFDLEAPGLHRYFVSEASGEAKSQLAAAAGTIEFFGLLEARFEHILAGQSFDQGAGEPDDADQVQLRTAIAELLDGGHFIQRVFVDNPNRPGARVSLDLMRAGRFDSDYPERVRRFAWQDFYEKFPFFVDLLSAEIGSRYDYALIDSRTGTTDVGNLCTVLLPEKLVLVFTPNEQSLHGAAEVGLQAVELRKASQDLRPLPLFPLMSRVENAENELQRRWIAQAKSRFEQVFRVGYGVEKSLSLYFDAVQIPHKSFYAYGESIAAARERVSEAHSLASAFRDFSEILACNSAIDAQTLMSKNSHGRFSADAPSSAAPGAPELGDGDGSVRSSTVPSVNSVPAVDVAVPGFARLRPAWRVALAVSGALILLALVGLGFWSSRAPAEGSASMSSASAGWVWIRPIESAPLPTPSAVVAPPSNPVGTAVPIPARAARPGVVESAGQPLLPHANPRALPPSLPASLDQALSTTLTIKANSKLIPGVRGASGNQMYNFNVWIEGPRDATSRIASVDYFFDHPSFSTKHFGSDAEPDFMRGYKGWGCLAAIVVTVRWKSGAQSPLPFNQCAALDEPPEVTAR